MGEGRPCQPPGLPLRPPGYQDHPPAEGPATGQTSRETRYDVMSLTSADATTAELAHLKGLIQCQGRAITTYCRNRKSSRRWQLSTDRSFSRRCILIPVTDAADQPLSTKKE